MGVLQSGGDNGVLRHIPRGPAEPNRSGTEKRRGRSPRAVPEFDEGRAAAAQQLHALTKRSLVIAVFEVGAELAGAIGGQEDSRVSAVSEVRDLLI